MTNALSYKTMSEQEGKQRIIRRWFSSCKNLASTGKNPTELLYEKD